MERDRFALSTLSSLFNFFNMPRQVDFYGRTFPSLAVYIYKSVILFDDSIDRGNPQPRALAHLLGREKGIEDMAQYFLVHAAAIVAYLEKNIIARQKAGTHGTVIFIKRHVMGFDGDFSYILYSITRIAAQVCQNLVDLG